MHKMNSSTPLQRLNNSGYGFMFLALLPTFAHASECGKYANLLRSQSDKIVGFGSGISSELAVENSQLDLAKQVRVAVVEKSQKREKNNLSDSNSDSNSNPNSDLDEIYDARVGIAIEGSEVFRRCRTVVGNHEAVVILNKLKLVKSLAEELESMSRQAEHKRAMLDSAPAQSRTEAIVAVADFLDSFSGEFDTRYSVCRAYAGCTRVHRSDWEYLSLYMSRGDVQKELIQVRPLSYRADNPLAETLKDRVILLLEAEKVKVSEKVATGNEVNVWCDETVSPPVEENTLPVVEVELSCQAGIILAGKKSFVYRFAGKGTAPAPEQGRVIATEQLSMVRNK